MSQTSTMQRLGQVRAELEREFPAFAAAYERQVQHLRERGFAEDALQAGESMPPFLLPNAEGRMVTSDRLLQRGPMVLTFYRGDWCTFCSGFLDVMAAATEAIEAEGGHIVCVTGETGGRALAAKRARGARFEILCDADLGLALSFGLVFPLLEELRDLARSDSVYFPEIYGNDSWFLPITATYVVDAEGRIAAADVDPDFRRRMDPAEMVAALRRLTARQGGG